MFHCAGFSRRLVFPITLLVGWSLGSSRGVAAIIHPQVNYATSGMIDQAGRTGEAAVRFVPATGTTDESSPFSLGAFLIEPPSDGTSTRYDQTPILISYATRAIDGISTAGGDGTLARPMAIRGWMSGSVGGEAPDRISILFDQGVQPADPRYYQPRPLPPLPAGSSLGTGSPGTLSLLGGKSLLNLNPAGTATPIEAQVDLALNVPEPASCLVYLGVIGGYLSARWRQQHSSN